MSQEQHVSRLPLVIMAAVIGMVALLTAALLAARSPANYPDGSPEAALQDFVAAALDHDESAMSDLLTADSNARCASELDEIDERRWAREGLRADLESIEIEGSEADAVVEFRRLDDGDIFGSTSWGFEARFELVRVDGRWLVDRLGWPDELERCSRGGN